MAAGGTYVTDEMLDEWSDAAERGELPGTPGPLIPGPPTASAMFRACADLLSLDANQRSKIETIAYTKHIPEAQVVRELIDAA